MMKEHLEEIKELFKENNEQLSIETADLDVLCYKLLISGNKNIDNVYEIFLPRFFNNLKEIKNDCR